MPLIPFDGQLDDEPIGGKLVPFEGELDNEPKKKKKASLGTAVKSSFANVGNMADTALSTLAGSAAALFGDEQEAVRIADEMEARRASRNQWANPDQEEIGFGGKVAGALATLPLQVAGMGFSPAETTRTALEAGETNEAARRAGLIDAAGNALGVAIPGFKQGSMAVRAATGAGVNAAQDVATKLAIQSQLETEAGKRAFAPTAEDAAVAGVIGGGFGAVAGKPSTKQAKTLKDIREAQARKAPVTQPEAPAPVVTPEQLRLFDQFEERSPISPYQTEMAPDMWRVDENGIPIRADLSMEAQNLQQPLQMNLWGDEMEANFPRDPNKPLDMATGDIPGVERFSDPVQFKNDPEGQIPLTQAIDMMPEGIRSRNPDGSFAKGTTRQNALDLLRRELFPDSEMRTAVQEAEMQQWLRENAVDTKKPAPLGSKARKEQVRKMGWAKKQGGAIDPDVFLKDFPDFITSKIKDVSGKLKPLFRGIKEDYTSKDRPMLGTLGEGIYLTESKTMANNYARGGTEGRQVRSYYADVKNPYVMEIGSEQHGDLLLSDRETRKAFSDRIKAEGYDGVIVKAGDELKEVMVFSPDQMKNAFSTPSTAIPKSQRGAVLIDWGKAADDMENSLLKASGDGSYIPENPEISNILEKARGEKDGKFWKPVQSGSTSVAMKTGSTLIKGVSEIIQNALKRSELKTRQWVFPAEGALRKLSNQDLMNLSTLMKDEMFQGFRYDPEVLAENLSVKQLEAYARMRDVFDQTLAVQNEARVAQGKTPISAKEAYLSSRWEGDFRQPVYDADGKLVWYLASNSKIGLKKQAERLLAQAPELKLGEQHKVQSLRGGSDIQSMYSTMLDILGRDDPAVQKVKELVEMNVGEDVANMLAQEKHFKKKANIRGFVGDRPGTEGSVVEARKMFQQQIQYAKNAFKWSEFQKSAKDLKGMLSDEELQRSQPNNIAYAREYVRNALGQNEGKVAKALDDAIRDLGLSPRVVDKAVGSLKSFFILQKLAVSAGFMAANVIQTANVMPHLVNLREKGFKGNPAKAAMVGTLAGPLMAFSHYFKAAGVEYIDQLPNQFFKDAIRYAEDNGVTARSVFDESPLGTSRTEKIAGMTLSAPETFVRSMAFMTYAQMLKDSGEFKDHSKLFQMAEELTNMSMVDYRETERPLVFGKLGTMGNFLNTLQTYPMNFYNQWNYMLREAVDGRPGAIMTMLAIQYSIAGAMGVPGFDDMDKVYKWIRDNWTSTDTWAAAMKHPFFSDPKLWMLENFGEASVYGALSDVSGIGFTSRVTAPSLGAMGQSPLAPITDIAKQVGSVAKAVADPTNTVKLGQAAMDVSPVGLKGLLETAPFMEGITYDVNPDGTKRFYKTTDLADKKARVNRTEEDIAVRKWGLKTQREVLEGDVSYATDSQNRSIQTRSGELIDRYYSAVRRGDVKKARELNELYISLTGRAISNTQIETQIKEEMMTDVQRTNSRAKTPQQLLNIVRMNKILEESK